MKHHEKRLQQKILFFRSSHSQVFIKKVFLGISLNLQENSCIGVSIGVVTGFEAATLLKKKPDTDVLLQFLRGC